MTELKRPGKTGGMRHVALFVDDLERAVWFYVELLGMTIEWQPDDNNVYLTSGNDNLALHRRVDQQLADAASQRLDHIGFILGNIDDVDQWHDFFVANAVAIKASPRTHRDGARSFYCLDPAGTLVQMIYHPPISKVECS